MNFSTELLFSVYVILQYHSNEALMSTHLNSQEVVIAYLIHVAIPLSFYIEIIRSQRTTTELELGQFPRIFPFPIFPFLRYT